MDTNFKVGDKVLFGRSHGERTLGEVVKVNRVKIKVRQLETRGTFKSHKVGTVWTVPPSLVIPAEGAAARFENELPRLRAEVAPKPKRSEAELMQAIVVLYNNLSPENLACDGEASMSQIRRWAAQYNRQLRECFTELGRRVSETEAYDWSDKVRKSSPREEAMWGRA